MKRIGKHLSCVAMVAVCALSAYTARGESLSLLGMLWPGPVGVVELEVFALSPGDSFAEPALDHFSQEGWSTLPASGSPVYAVATGNPTTTVPFSFDIYLNNEPPPTVSFGFIAWYAPGHPDGIYGGGVYAGSLGDDGALKWLYTPFQSTYPTTWDTLRPVPTNPNDPIIPEPASAGLLVLGLLGLLGRRRRAQAA